MRDPCLTSNLRDVHFLFCFFSFAAVLEKSTNRDVQAAKQQVCLRVYADKDKESIPRKYINGMNRKGSSHFFVIWLSRYPISTMDLKGFQELVLRVKICVTIFPTCVTCRWANSKLLQLVCTTLCILLYMYNVNFKSRSHRDATCFLRAVCCVYFILV